MNLLHGLLVFLCLPLTLLAERKALIFGNNAYENLPRLQNARNDAVALSQHLEKAGWTVTLVTDAELAIMLSKLKKFAASTGKAEMALFYFAGHGFEVGKENFLAPVDSANGPAADLAAGALRLSDVGTLLTQKGSAKLNLVILDCCREAPNAAPGSTSGPRTKGGFRGTMAAPTPSEMAGGVLLAFAGAPGKSVPDGEGSMGPYMQALLKNLTPGRDCLSVLGGTAKVLPEQQPYVRFDDKGATLDGYRNFPLIPGKPEASSVIPAADTKQFSGRYLKGQCVDVRSLKGGHIEVSLDIISLNDPGFVGSIHLSQRDPGNVNTPLSEHYANAEMRLTTADGSELKLVDSTGVAFNNANIHSSRPTALSNTKSKRITLKFAPLSGTKAASPFSLRGTIINGAYTEGSTVPIAAYKVEIHLEGLSPK